MIVALLGAIALEIGLSRMVLQRELTGLSLIMLLLCLFNPSYLLLSGNWLSLLMCMSGIASLLPSCPIQLLTLSGTRRSLM